MADPQITPDELIQELQHQLSNLFTQLAAQNILIRKLQEGSNATAQETEEDKRDDGEPAGGSGEGYV